MNGVDRLAIKGLIFLCLPWLAFTLYLQHVETKEMAQVERQTKLAPPKPDIWNTPNQYEVDFLTDITFGKQYASIQPVVLKRRAR